MLHLFFCRDAKVELLLAAHLSASQQVTTKYTIDFINMKTLFPISFFLFLTLSVSGAIPKDYYSSLDGLTSAALKTAVHVIICQDTTSYLKYGSNTGHTWQGFYSTDRDTINNTVIDMYSDSLRKFPDGYVALGYPGFGSTIQIEHSVPKSWWGCDITHPDCAARDLNHLYPSDGKYNDYKSDNPLGEVTGTLAHTNGETKIGIGGPYDGYTGTVFEPADKYKGDFARGYFYVATAYQHYVDKWKVTTSQGIMMEADTYPTLKPGAIQLLLKWSRQDPVSRKELTRVEKVYAIQKNRNPFIDHPELAEYIWGNMKDSVYRVAAHPSATAPTAVNRPTVRKLTISPNPAKGQIHLSIDGNTGIFRYAIYSMTGSVVTSGDTAMPTINVSCLKSGVYSCVVKANSENLVSKLIIL